MVGVNGVRTDVQHLSVSSKGFIRELFKAVCWIVVILDVLELLRLKEQLSALCLLVSFY